jgi:SAM-dependent methyltransferase
MNKNDVNSMNIKNSWLMVHDWYGSNLGQAVLVHEKEILTTLLEHIFGYTLVQIGSLDNYGLLTKSRISNQYLIDSLLNTKRINNTHQIMANFIQLPLQNNSIDAVILPHTLEFESNPHQILREVERILVAEGKAIFLGFNPYSLWGLWHKYWEVKIKIATYKQCNDSVYSIPLPSSGQLISQKRLSDWLQLLGFDIDQVCQYFYRPPIKNSVLLKKLEFMEQAGQFSKILPAGGYMIVATKRVSTLTPIRQNWQLSRQLLTSQTVKMIDFKSSE